eukprot:CFRG2885T1
MSETREYIDKLNQEYISNHPELVRLLRKGEGIAELLSWDAETVLLKWVNYHLARAGDEHRAENLETDLSDSYILSKVLIQIGVSPESATQLAAIPTMNDTLARGQTIVTCVNAKCADVGGSKWASADDIVKANKNNVVAMIASLFYSFLTIKMPSEAEIDELYKDIDGFKEQLRSCRVCREQYLVKITYLENDVATLRRRKEELEAGIAERKEEHVQSITLCKTMIKEKDGEIQRITDAIVMRENELKAKLAELAALTQDKKTMEVSKNEIISNNKNRIFELESKIAALKAGNAQMRELLAGKGNSAQELQEALNLSAKESAEKSRVVIEYLTKVQTLLDTIVDQLPEESKVRQHETEDVSQVDDGEQIVGAKADQTDDCWEEKTRLRENRDLQMKVLEGMEELLALRKQQTADHVDKERARLEDLQRAVADYLQEGQENALDGIANMKRFLGLMIEKAKKQAMQIGTLEFTIEKKNQLNDVMAEKVKQIAEEQMKKGNILKNLRNKGRRNQKRAPSNTPTSVGSE